MNDLHALSGAYAVDALDDAERTAFEAHLATCAECRTEVRELRETAGTLTDLTATAPSTDVRDAVLRGIDRVRPLPPLPATGETTHTGQASETRDSAGPHGSVGPDGEAAPDAAAEAAAPESASVTPLRRRPLRTALVAAAAAAVLVGGGLAITQPWQDDSSQELSAADRVLTASDAQEVALDLPDGASARLVRSVQEGRAVLVTRDMPAAPSGRDYQLWLQTPAGDMVDAGLMPDASDQTVLLDGDASEATGAGITVEPDGGSPQPTTEPIALFDLTQG